MDILYGKNFLKDLIWTIQIIKNSYNYKFKQYTKTLAT